MALKILPASEPLTVNQIILALYGQPGVGKTTLAFTAEAPLLLDFDKGAYRAAGRKDTVQIKAWADVANIEAADIAEYKTVIVDTAGRALDVLAADIMRRDPKLGRGGALSQQGWGRLKAEFTGWLKLLQSFGKDVVLIAHGTEKQDGDETTVRLDVQGGSKDEIYKSADIMGRIFISSARRMITFDPTDTAYGKNPGGIEQSTVPANDSAFLAKIISKTKDAINAFSAESQAEFERVEKFKADLYAMTTPEEFTAMVDGMKKRSEKDRAIFHSVATDKGFTFDKKAGAYIKQAA